MIFCVEDDPNIRELEVYTLQSVGFKALGIGSGDELFKALECGKKYAGTDPAGYHAPG